MTRNARAAQAALPLFAEGHAFRKAMMALSATAMKNIVAASRAAEVFDELEIFLRYQQAKKSDEGITAEALKQLLEQMKNMHDDMLLTCAFLGQVARLHKAFKEER